MAIVIDKSQRWRLIAAHVFLIALCAMVIFPLVMVVSISLRPGNFATGTLIPETISLEHWRFALGIPSPGPDGQMIKPDLPVLLWLWNSVKVATISATVALFLSTTAAYAFARMKFAGKKAALLGLMLMQMFPTVLALIAIHAIFSRIGHAFPLFGVDSHWALVLAYSGGIALHIWTIKGLRNHPGRDRRGGHRGRRHALAGLLASAPAHGPAHPHGRFPAGLHRGDHRISAGLCAAP